MKSSLLTHTLAPALLLGLLFFSSCNKPADKTPVAEEPSVSPAVRIAATVNGEPITLADFQERFARAGLKPEKEAELEVKREYLNRLVERAMLLREAQRRRIRVGLAEINKRIEALRAEHGHDVKSGLAGLGIDFEKWKSDLWEELMIERLVAYEVGRRVSVTPEEVKSYYRANPLEFENPERVRARQIVVDTESEASRAMERLQAPDTDFAAVAREMSTAPEAVRGGDLGYFAAGDMPPEFNVVFELAAGGMSGIVKSPYGYHIFKLEDRREAGKTAFEDAADGISEKLRRKKEDAKYGQWLRGLRARTKFVLNYEALE
jgi:peptidyl-prolyl cis-trans isomerase C